MDIRDASCVNDALHLHPPSALFSFIFVYPVWLEPMISWDKTKSDWCIGKNANTSIINSVIGEAQTAQ